MTEPQSIFRVDNRFPSHPKLVPLESDPLLWAAANALWLSAGCYCAQNATGGYIAWSRLERLTPLGAERTREVALALIHRARMDGSDFGLWEEAEGGVRFHDWSDYAGRPPPPSNTPRPTNGERSRTSAAERQARYRKRKGDGSRDAGRAPPRHENITRDASLSDGSRDAERHAVTPFPPHPPFEENEIETKQNPLVSKPLGNQIARGRTQNPAQEAASKQVQTAATRDDNRRAHRDAVTVYRHASRVTERDANVVPIRRAPRDAVEGQTLLTRMLGEVWHRERGLPLNANDFEIRRAALWLWEAVRGDADAYLDALPDLLSRWTRTSYFEENHRRRNFDPAKSFRIAIDRLFAARLDTERESRPMRLSDNRRCELMWDWIHAELRLLRSELGRELTSEESMPLIDRIRAVAWKAPDAELLKWEAKAS